MGRRERETCMLFEADWWNPVMVKYGNEGEKRIKDHMDHCTSHQTKR